MRVYEFSKKSGIANKDLIKMLNDGGFNVQTHMSMLNQDSLNFLQKQLEKDTTTKKETEPKKKEKKEVEILAEKKQTTQKNETKPQVQVKIEEPKIKIEQPKKEELNQKEKKVEEQKKPVKNIVLKSMSVAELAEKLSMPSTELILHLLKKGMGFNKNQVLPIEIVEQIIKHFGFETVEEEKFISEHKTKIGKTLTRRLPVVVVIGHVDHGKTTLLDFIRKTKVASREKGGITQHLGAYQVKLAQGGIVFLDTPGHEAFSMMRGRGVGVADIAVLMVAADDGVMPQTVEAIKLAQSKNVPIIVALNKIDKVDETRIEQVKNQLSKHNLIAEDWGGQTIFVPISAKLGQGIDQLLDMILLQAEIMELTADESFDACGYILESKFEKGLGPVGTFIAQHGTIKIGDYFVCGDTYGKVTVLIDSFGTRLQKAGPSIPMKISGFEELPKVGDYLQVITSEEFRKIKADKSDRKINSLKAIPKESINVILKTDNDSSKEALLNSIKNLAKKDEKDIYIVNSGVGDINENDVILASSVGAVVYGFGVKTDSNINALAQKKSVSIKLFDIIYHLLDDMRALIESKKEVQLKRVKTGEATVRKVFNIKGIGVIAGFYVKDGKIVKNGRIVVLRANKKIGEGGIKTLQRDKKVMKEIATGFEGALLIDGYQDWAIDDTIECYIEVPV